MKNPATRQLIYDQMMEVIGAANALGAEVKPAKRCLKGVSPYKFREILHTE
jgi:hypothetical protein